MMTPSRYPRGAAMLLALVATLATAFVFPEAAVAQRRGGFHYPAARPSNATAFRAGQTVGRRQGYAVGVNRGYAAGVHTGYHAGYHAGAWSHPWAYRAPTMWAWHPTGYFVAALATTAVVVSIVNSSGKQESSSTPTGSVYYDQGVYYEQTSDGYKAIAPPPGAQIATLPEGYTQVSTGGQSYAYYQGVFYSENNGKYVVTKAPIGAIVPYVPDAATESDNNGTKDYSYGGVTFQAVSLNGETSYLVTAS